MPSILCSQSYNVPMLEIYKISVIHMKSSILAKVEEKLYRDLKSILNLTDLKKI